MSASGTELGSAASGGVHLSRSLKRLDIIFFTVGATFTLDAIAQIAATGGAESFVWGLIVAATFLLPYGLITAEMGSAFPQEGGPYFWVKFAFGRFAAAISTMLWWVTNPVWLGGSLVFVATATWDAYIVHMSNGSFGDYVFKLIFIWTGILAAVVSIRLGKHFLNVGTVIKLAMVAFFMLTVIIYAFQHGLHGYAFGDYAPTIGGFLAVTPVMLFAVSGYEAPNGAAEEMQDPQRDVPRSVAVAGSIATVSYLLPILAILLVLPVKNITGAGGFMDAIATVYSVYGGAGGAMLKITALLFIFTLVHQGAAWMIGSDRVQAIAGLDGSFLKFFGVFHPKLETPVRVNLLSGVIASVFCILATEIVSGSAAAIFGVVLSMAVTTLLLSYLIILPAARKLRRTHPDVVRPFRVPGGERGMLICTVLTFLWIAFGSFCALFPDVLEKVFGVEYDFFDYWGVSRTTFEAFTLGTLAVIIGIAVVGYLVRRANGQDDTATAVPQSQPAD